MYFRRMIIIKFGLYQKIYEKLEWENLSDQFYRFLQASSDRVAVSRFFKKKLYQYWHVSDFNCLQCYLSKGKGDHSWSTTVVLTIVVL